MANGDPVAEAQAVLDAGYAMHSSKLREALASMIALNRSLLEPLGDEGRAWCARLRKRHTPNGSGVVRNYNPDGPAVADFIERQSAALAAQHEAAREYHLIKRVAHAAHHVLDDAEYDEIREASLPASVDELEAALNAWEEEFPDWHETMDETRAILARPATRADAGVVEGEVCTGCGTTKTLDKIKAINPQALSCCPERKMVPVRQIWRECYETQRQLDALTKGVAAVRLYIHESRNMSYVATTIGQILDQYLPPAAPAEGER